MSGLLPASIRFFNPGGMYPGESSRRYGSDGHDIIGGGHKIARFPDAESGAAAQFDLWDRGYTGMTLRDATRKWSGNNSSDAYTTHLARATGLTPDAVITKDMLRDPKFAIPLARAAAQWEAGRPYPMDESAWSRAHARFLGGPQSSPTPQPPDGMDASTYGAPSPPPSPRMALGGPKPMPQDPNTGEWVPEQEIARRRSLANQMWDVPTSGGGWAGALASLLSGGAHGYQNAKMSQAIGGNEQFSNAAMQRALGANGIPGVIDALAAGSPEQKKSALSLMLQEKDPVRALDRQIKQLELDQKKAEIAEEAMLFGGAPSPRPAAPAPAMPPPSAPPSAATPPSVPGISVAPPTPSPVVTGSVPTPAAAPAPQRPRTNEELRAVLATRSPYEVVQWRKLARKDPKEALKMLDDWTNPNKEQDKSRMKEAGEGQGKAQAALPGIVSTTDSLLRKIDDVLHEPDPKNPGKYLPDPKKPGQFIPNQTLPQVVGSFDGHPWNPTFRSSSVDMQERLKQVRGGAFLQAFESLRGAGSITEKEAEPATAALARLDNLRQSEEGYIEALNDFRKEVLRLRQLAFDRASGKLPMPSLEPPSPQAAGGPPGTAKPDPLGIR
jgi:hypothetical protein